MKTILYLLAVALCVAEVPNGEALQLKAPSSGSSLFLETPSSIRLTVPKCLMIVSGGGHITIEYATGKVTLSEGVKLDDAAIQFWKAVAEAFPEARRAIIGDGKTVEWAEMGAGVSLNANRRPISIGLRSDGVVVWREVSK